MASDRRRGGENSAMRAALVEAAEQLIREEGYPAVTARTLAERVNLKRQIAHYYFRTMDDVFIEVVRRNSEKMKAGVIAAMESEEPLRALQDFNRDPDQAILCVELSALASRRPAVREEVARAAEDFRALQTRLLTGYLERRGIQPTMQPIVAIVLLTTLAQSLALEAAIDVHSGHAETLQFAEDCLKAFSNEHDTPLQIYLRASEPPARKRSKAKLEPS